MATIDYREYEKMSPFEIKDGLLKLAKQQRAEIRFYLAQCRTRQSQLDCDRAARRVFPVRPVCADRVPAHDGQSESRARRHAAKGRHRGSSGSLADQARRHARRRLPVENGAARGDGDGFDADAFVFELTDSIIGDNYPVPDRMLVHAEQVAHRYLMWAMCGDTPPSGKFDLYAVEGGTAAMCYIFKSLMANRILKKGDTIAMGTPIFTPYIEIAELEDYAFKAVHIRRRRSIAFNIPTRRSRSSKTRRSRRSSWSIPAIRPRWRSTRTTLKKLVDFVKTKRPDLILLTDDVYGTFVPGFRSLMAELPHNTIGVYSYSKYFGCTGWRLGVIAIHEKNILDDLIAKLPAKELEALDERYISITLEPRKLKMIDRIVADSRDVALNHTAGLSLPQQVMMTMFSMSELMDTEKVYQKACMEICQRRVDSLLEGLPLDVQPNPIFADYYGTDRFRVLAAQDTSRRRDGRMAEEERASARPRLPAGRRPFDRAAQWRRVRCAELERARLVRQSAGRCL